MKIIELLKGRKSVDDFEAALAENEREMGVLKARLSEISGQRESTLMDGGEAALAKLDAEAVEIRRKLEVLGLAASGLAKRRDAAEEEQQRLRDEELARKAKKDILAPLQDALRSYHAAAMALAESVQRVESLDASLRHLNHELAARGRNDLELPLPYGPASLLLKNFAKENGPAHLVSEAWEGEAEKAGAAAIADEHWINLPKPIAPPSMQSLTVPGYVERGQVRWEQPYRFV